MIGLPMLIVLVLSTSVQQEVPGETVAPSSSRASLACSAGPDNKVQTSEVRGPDGSAFALAIASDDDHLKDSHQCESAYSLLVTRVSLFVQLTLDLAPSIATDEGLRLERRVSRRTVGDSSD